MIEITDVKETGHIEVRETTKDENGKLKHHRHVVSPGDNVDNECQEVKDKAAEVWTPEIIQAEIDVQQDRRDDLEHISWTREAFEEYKATA